MDQRDRQNRYRHTYTEGNTVREYQAVPKQEPIPEKSREQILKERERRLAAKRNRQQALVINRGYAIFLIAMTLACVAVCCAFIRLQSDITTQLSQITTLESQISDLKSENAAAQSHLETSTTLEEIKAKASELGMVYPSSDQIQYYSVESSDYMNQYSDVESK